MSKRPPLIFGEVLFDCFPDRSRVLGGAPFNVAWHLQGFGLQPVFISRLGNDADGEDILQLMQRWDMQSSGVERDALHPTGRVNIKMQGKQHSFSILPEQAYDYIALDSLPSHSFSLLYFGSLIQRSATSRHSLHSLQKQGIPSFVDINLRQDCWTPEIVIDSIRQARWLKINDEELELLRDDLGIVGDFRQQLALDLREKYALDMLIVTCGAEGAFLVDQQQQVFSVAPQAHLDIVDTVGAGDAFSAVTIMGLLQGWQARDIVQRAQNFASRICQIQGATTQDKSLYEDFAASEGLPTVRLTN